MAEKAVPGRFAPNSGEGTISAGRLLGWLPYGRPEPGLPVGGWVRRDRLSGHSSYLTARQVLASASLFCNVSSGSAHQAFLQPQFHPRVARHRGARRFRVWLGLTHPKPLTDHSEAGRHRFDRTPRSGRNRAPGLGALKNPGLVDAWLGGETAGLAGPVGAGRVRNPEVSGCGMVFQSHVKTRSNSFHSTLEPNTEVFSKVSRSLAQFTLVNSVSTLLNKGGITCNCPSASQDFCKH